MKKSEERFRLAAKSTSDLIYEWDVDSDHLEWFGDIDGALGFDSGEIERTIEAWVEKIHPEDQEQLRDAVELHRRSAEPLYYEYRIMAKDGSWRHWVDRGIPILDENGCPTKWIGTCLDITDRKRTREALREALEFSEKILSEAPVGITIYDAESGQCLAGNKSMADIIGASEEEVLAQNFYTIQSWQKSGLLKTAKSALEEDSKKELDVSVRTTFGKDISIRCYFVPFRAGEEKYLLFTLDDFTERKHFMTFW